MEYFHTFVTVYLISGSALSIIASVIVILFSQNENEFDDGVQMLILSVFLGYLLFWAFLLAFLAIEFSE